MLSYIEILEKIKDILVHELDEEDISLKEIAHHLHVDYNNLRKQKARNSPHYYKIMMFLARRNISINWFYFNQLPESLIESTSNYIILKYQKSTFVSAGTGTINDELDSTPLVIDKQLLDYINSSYKYTEVLEVFGESMEPDIKDGSLVFVDKSQTNINEKDIYIVNTPNGLLIKKIELYDDKVTIKSSHEDFKDVEHISKDINIIGRVCGVFKELKKCK